MSEKIGTKEALARSMKSLMTEKSFDRISISDICEGCGLNRKSFYYHFKDKYDLLNWIFYTDFISLAAQSDFTNGWELFCAACRFMYRDRAFYRAALRSEGQNSFRDSFRECIQDVASSLFDAELNDKSDKIAADLISGTFLTIFDVWLGSPDPMEPETFIQTVREVILQITEALR